MNESDRLYFYGKHVSIEIEDLDWYYLLATRYAKAIIVDSDTYRGFSASQREAYEKERSYTKDRVDRLRRFIWQLRDLPSNSLIQLEKRRPTQ